MNTTNAAMQESGVEWIGAIPQDWRKDKIFRLAEFISSGGTPRSTTEDFYGGDIMWVQTGDLDNDFIDKSSKQLTLEGLKNSSAKLFPKNTLLIAMYGATIGKLGILATEATTNQACCAIFVSAKMDIKFTFYLFMAMKDYLVFQSYGGGQPNISQEIIKQQYVYCPKPPEQQAIAQYLDERCGKLDKIIAIKQQQIKTLDALRQSIIYQAVTKGLDASVPLVDSCVEWLGEIPKGWKVVRVKDVLDFYNTQRIPLSAADRGIMTNKEFDYYGASGIIDKVDNYLFDGIYTLVAEDGANLLTRNTPLAFIAKGKFWVNNHAHILKPRFGNINFFTHLLESMDYSLFVTGAAQPKLTKENLGRFKILNPPIAEQQAIADHLDQETQRLDQLKANLNQQINVLSDYKKSLIYECVTGKKRVIKAG